MTARPTAIAVRVLAGLDLFGGPDSMAAQVELLRGGHPWCSDSSLAPTLENRLADVAGRGCGRL